MFIAALFTIAKIWKQLKCPLIDEWIKRSGTYIQWNISHKKDGILSLATIWMDLEGDMLSERQIPYDFTYMWNL